jgi:dTDP-4-amino-4,6-dideoxygalactose transaminase
MTNNYLMRPIIPTFDMVSRYLIKMDQNHVYSNFGPLSFELEERYAKFFGVIPEKVVLCSSATIGLLGAVSTSTSHNIVAPAFTFVASIQAIVNAGKKCIFEDINPATMELDLTRATIDSNTSFLYVLPFGTGINLSKFNEKSEFIIDAAASIHAFEGNLDKLQEKHLIAFSLHATKVLGIGEGGVVVFGDIERAKVFRNWINFGFSTERISINYGLNGKLSEVNAAYGLAALDNWENEKKEWREARDLANQIIPENNIVSDISVKSFANPYFNIYINNNVALDQFKKILSDNNIPSRKWWSDGCHRMPAFQSFYNKDLPITDKLAKNIVGLPFYRKIKEEDYSKLKGIINTLLNSKFE